MNVTGPAVSDSLLAAQAARISAMQLQIAVKARDAEQQQAEAMQQLIEQVGELAVAGEPRLDVVG